MLTGVFQPFIEESAELENLVSVMHPSWNEYFCTFYVKGSLSSQ